MAPPAIPVIVARSGPGALCAEAQADGVPCADVAVPCEECAHARQQPTCTCQTFSASAGAPTVRTRLTTSGHHA
jgi:hypothetical protein